MKQIPEEDLITPLRMLRQLPSIARKAPKMLQGLVISRNTNPHKAAGLGWALERATLRWKYSLLS